MVTSWFSAGDEPIPTPQAWEGTPADEFTASDPAQLESFIKQIDTFSLPTIFTSEKVPGAVCECAVDWAQDKTVYENDGTPSVIPGQWESACGNITTRLYKCSVPPGLEGFQLVFAKLIRFLINIVLLLGVLAIVGLGIAWSFAGGQDVVAKSNLKKWAINIIMGLVILFLFRYILLFLAPWVYM